MVSGNLLLAIRHSHLPGAIAQLGERVLCKHEVVGSIPSGSTSFGGRTTEYGERKAARERAFRSLSCGLCVSLSGSDAKYQFEALKADERRGASSPESWLREGDWRRRRRIICPLSSVLCRLYLTS